MTKRKRVKRNEWEKLYSELARYVVKNLDNRIDETSDDFYKICMDIEAILVRWLLAMKDKYGEQLKEDK